MDNTVKEKTVNVGFIGNPNCGKTTLFNAYTGAKLKVANWPGVTVEKKKVLSDTTAMITSLLTSPVYTALLHIPWRNAFQDSTYLKMMLM